MSVLNEPYSVGEKMIRAIVAGLSILLASVSGPSWAQDKPNIVLVFMDNFGWGEPGFNGGGIIRGAATPELDQLAAEGLRLTNFNVESQCTPSRAAIMSGRYAVRTGNGTIPLGGGVYGLVQWEITLQARDRSSRSAAAPTSPICLATFSRKGRRYPTARTCRRRLD